VLIPGDRLGYVPWHAARVAGPAGPAYACERFAFSYAASARQLVAVARRPRTTDGPVTLVADPTGDLRWAASEVEALHRGPYPHATVLGHGAHHDGAGTPDQVLRALAGDTGPALLHLACHASTGATPDSSHLVLNGESRLPVARILAAAGGRPADAPGGLVVLSACASDLTTGAYDEALTLATAFLAAGAVSVVGSRWPVGDRTTACLMVMFHRYRTVDGLGDRDALRAAQRWMLDPQRDIPPEVRPLCPIRPNALADPVAWAAFTHHGH
jgi:CHAT domain-containing protein